MNTLLKPFYAVVPLSLEELFAEELKKLGIEKFRLEKGGCWFGATPAPGTAFSLVGCTVSPGFDMDDLRIGQPEELTLRYPMAKDCIREFCPPLNDAQREACRRCGDDE